MTRFGYVMTTYFAMLFMRSPKSPVPVATRWPHSAGPNRRWPTRPPRWAGVAA